MHRSTIALIGSLLVLLSGCTPHDHAFMEGNAPFLQTKASWVDSLIRQMPLEEKLGQLLLVNSSYYHPQKKADLIRWSQDGQIGGFLQTNIPSGDFVSLVNETQASAKVPLFVASNQSVSITNQFIDLPDYPAQASLTAIANDSVRSFLQNELIRQFENFGINLYFGPSLQMPQATDLSFSADQLTLDDPLFTNTLIRQLQAFQDHKIFTVAFPLEDTPFLADSDTSSVKPDSSAIVQALVQNGLSGLITDPSVFSHPVVKELPSFYLKTYLQQTYQFGGLVFAELPNPDSIEAVLFSGTDMLIVDQQIDLIHQKLIELVETGMLSQKILDQKVRKILMAKAWTGATPTQKNTPDRNAHYQLSAFNHAYFTKKLFESSVVLASNPQLVIPFDDLYQPTQVIEAGKVAPDLKSFIAKFIDFENIRISIDKEFASLDIAPKRTIVSINQITLSPAKHARFIRQINHLSKTYPVLVVNFGSPFNLNYFDPSVALIQAGEDVATAQRYAAQIIFGGVQAKGKLSMTISAMLPEGHGLVNDVIRVNFDAAPEDAGLYSHKLLAIDAIAQNAINQKAIPGCQILVAKAGMVVYNKSFGHHTYDQVRRVQSDDLYDVASITKIAATTLAAMKLFDQGKFSLNHRIGSYLDIPEDSPVHNILIRDLLTHQSGLKANMPIWRHVMNHIKSVEDSLASFSRTGAYPFSTQVADSLFFKTALQDSIWKEVYKYELDRHHEVRYSDVNFFLLQKLFEKISGKRLDDYLYERFYQPLGLRHLVFKPLKTFSKDQIIPTEYDQWWRQQLLQGHVHDEAAALFGGVAGNAGLFGNSEALAVLFQLFVAEGRYAGKSFLSPQTIRLFTEPIKKIERGLGFDVIKTGGYIKNGTFRFKEVYGHTGFTGTCVWIDPEEELIYIFLSNRVFPDADNNLLNKLKVRSRIQSAIYRALIPQPSLEELLEIS